MTAQVVIRVSAFLGVLGVMASLELLIPRRRLTTSKVRRWIANLSVVVLDAIIVRLLFAAGAVGAALLAAEKTWGLLNYLAWPIWVGSGLVGVALGFKVYVQDV